ncbi:hypothetical protein DPMN_052757 [Dreissena polymorpha]|uniref:Uncharacterized protein n=1 Tax=Dreissena polymorpha TaxID=45954 RepID=A0A9D4HQ34_DREPO|nr:hypothetical protein DPMN_052757 [Dreissena polymorpha]
MAKIAVLSLTIARERAGWITHRPMPEQMSTIFKENIFKRQRVATTQGSGEKRVNMEPVARISEPNMLASRLRKGQHHISVTAKQN